MSHRKTIHLPAEKTLVLTATEFAEVQVNRLQSGQAPVMTAKAIKGRTIRVGPFSEPRDFGLISEDSGFEASIIQEDERLAYNHEGTGILTGGIISINAIDDTKFDISAGEGVIVDNSTNAGNPVVQHVQWDDIIGIDTTYLATAVNSFPGIDVQGNVVQFDTDPTPLQRRDNIMLGILIHTPRTQLVSVVTRPYTAYDQDHAFIDLASSLGLVNISGNVFSANGANLKVNKSAGSSFRIGSNYVNSKESPNVTNNNALTAPEVLRVIRDGAGDFTNIPGFDTIDVANYDNGSGTPVALTGSDIFAIWRIYYAPAAERVIATYPQKGYPTLASAEGAIFGEEYETNPELDQSILRGYLIVRRSATDLSDTADAKFIVAANFGGAPSAGVSTSTTTLQAAYNNSEDPEILTDATRGALTVKEGTGTATNKVIQGLNNSDVEVFYVTGEGKMRSAIEGGVTGSRPGSPLEFEMYFDTTLGKPIWYDGTNWVDATGATV